MRWKKPQWNEDGSKLVDLDHYRIYVASQRGAYQWDRPTVLVQGQHTRVACPDAIRDTPGQYYAVILAVNEHWRVSAPSNEFAFEVQRLATPIRGLRWHVRDGW